MLFTLHLQFCRTRRHILCVEKVEHFARSRLRKWQMPWIAQRISSLLYCCFNTTAASKFCPKCLFSWGRREPYNFKPKVTIHPAKGNRLTFGLSLSQGIYKPNVWCYVWDSLTFKRVLDGCSNHIKILPGGTTLHLQELWLLRPRATTYHISGV